MRDVSWFRAIVDAFDALLLSGDHDVIRVVGAAPMGGDFLEIVLDEAPLRQAMLRFSANILLLSLIISGITATLVYLALHYLLVRPMRRITANMMAFRADPENPSRIIAPSKRHDEIGAGRARTRLDAERPDLDAASEEPARGARARGVEDQPRSAQHAGLGATVLRRAVDPAAIRACSASRRSCMRALERAIEFCQSTLSYGRAQEPPPDRKMIALEPLVEEVRETLGLAATAHDRLDRRRSSAASTVDADHDQLFRVLLNLARNAVQALEARAPNDPLRDQIRITGRREGGVVVIEVADTGPGFPPQRARASVRGVPGLDPARRHRAWACHRGRTDPRPWRRNPAGRGHHRRDLPPHHSGPGGRSRRPSRERGRERLIRLRMWPDAGTRGLAADPCQCGPGDAIAMPRFRAPRGASVAERQAPVAQLDRAPDYKSGGQEFEISSGAPTIILNNPAA